MWCSGGRRGWHRDQLRHLPEVLGGGGEGELVSRTVRASKSQAIEPEDALEMSEEHLDLLAKPA